MHDQDTMPDTDAMLKVVASLDTIDMHTGITAAQRAKVWDAMTDPRANWLAAHRVKITPMRTLGEVIQGRTGNPPFHVPTPADILEALLDVTTPKEAPEVERSPRDDTDR